MKTELSKIAKDLEQGTITENEARTLLLGLLSVNKMLLEDICKINGHAMYPVYKLDNTANGHTSHFGQNKCSRCGYEEDWQYDM